MSTKYIVNNVSGQTINGDLTINGDVVITGTTNTRPYKVYTALLTQSGGDNQQANDNETQYPFVIGVSYYIEENTNQNTNNSADFTNIGALNNDGGTHFIATGTTPNSWGNGGYVNLTYNLGAPVVTVLENTIGNIWFTYESIGVYNIMSNASFTDNKTYCSATLSNYNYDSTNVMLGYFNSDIVQMTTLLPTDSRYNGSDTSIEIRVYN